MEELSKLNVFDILKNGDGTMSHALSRARFVHGHFTVSSRVDFDSDYSYAKRYGCIAHRVEMVINQIANCVLDAVVSHQNILGDEGRAAT